MLEELRQKPEAHRKKVALATSLIISLFIFSGWFYSKGFLGIRESKETVATAVVQEESNKTTFSSVFSQFSNQYELIKDSIASVMVPFITGIDVYQKSK